MGYSLEELHEETRQVSIQAGNGTIEIVYRPHVMTSEFESEMEMDGNASDTLKRLKKLIVSWDLTDKPLSKGGKVLPVSEANLAKLSYGIQGLIFTKIAEDQSPKKPMETPSGSFD